MQNRSGPVYDNFIKPKNNTITQMSHVSKLFLLWLIYSETNAKKKLRKLNIIGSGSQILLKNNKLYLRYKF